MTEPLAALRDASWHRRPGKSLQRHIVLNDEWHAACSPVKPGRQWPRMLLVDYTAVPASEVLEVARCMRPGCRERWPRT
jgi:hypothetical protein